MTALEMPLITKVSQASRKTRCNRILASQFGQGFGQFAKDGYNSQFDKWQIVFDNLNSTDRATLNTFYETVGSDVWFSYTANGDSASKKWRIDKDTFKEAPLSGNLYSISFNITQQFDLGT
jgi:phage-related protein